MILYADSSALAKRYISESGSGEVETLLRLAEVVGTGLITRVEVSAALARLVRTGALRRQAAETILRVFRKHWLELTTIQLTEALVAEADSLAWEQDLRGYDAVHLASALSWQRGLESVVTLATFDADLWAAGQRVGLGVWPERVE
ncbi:MAG: type II toxin-antitoxin system VapC family toxin [Anaerolineales bacterium]